MKIPNWPQADEREAELIRMVLESPQWGGFHPFVAEFEQTFARFQDAAHGISTFNGTVSLELALAVLGIGVGHEVIVPAISFISTASAVSRVGATPVFVDIERDSFNLDPNRIPAAISPRTKAVIAVHFGGTMCNMDSLGAICAKHGLFLIEDAAHAHGAEWKSQRAGSFGVVGSFSFQNGKVLSAGEGGMLVTNHEEFARVSRSIANCGREAGRSFYDHVRVGTNLRMTALQAAVLIAQLERLPSQIAQRTENAALLKRELAGLDEVAWQEQHANVTQNPYYLLVGRLNDPETSRDVFCQALAELGIPAVPFYPHTLYRNEMYRHSPNRVMPCPVAEARIHDAFWLGHRLLMAEECSMREAAVAIAEAAKQARLPTGMASR
jgi:dTDP-4-amino-4,6-dideoxygalactose transaminase